MGARRRARAFAVAAAISVVAGAVTGSPWWAGSALGFSIAVMVTLAGAGRG
jgi:uncharacterized protein (DUF58 family)